MRTSTRTPRLSWLQLFPMDFVSDPKFLAMTAAGRGALFSLILYGWPPATQGNGLCADAASLQRITSTTPLEWDAIRQDVLQFFEVREDGRLYLPWLMEAARDAVDKVAKLKKSAETKNLERKNTDETDEIRLDRLDKNGRPNGPSNGRPNERPNGQPSTTSTHLDGSSSVPPAAASDPFAQKQGSDSSPSSDEPDDEGSTPSAPAEKPEPTGRENLDAVSRIQEYAHNLGWKLPSPRDVEQLLKSQSPEDICAAMDDYDGNLNDDSGDRNYAEYKFFVEGGAAAVIAAMKSEAARFGV